MAKPKTPTKKRKCQSTIAKAPLTCTAWDSVVTSYPVILTESAFRGEITNPDINYLAGLPATRVYRALTNKWAYTLEGDRNRRVKAALAQAAGTPADIACEHCRRGLGIWEVCINAPLKKTGSRGVFEGACPSCYYEGIAHQCSSRLDAASAPPSSAPATLIRPSNAASPYVPSPPSPDAKKLKTFTPKPKHSTPKVKNSTPKVKQRAPSPSLSPSPMVTKASRNGLGERMAYRNVIISTIDAEAQWDFTVQNGKVLGRRPASPSSLPAKLLLPSLCHPHIHLDKAYIHTCNQPPSDAYPEYSDLAPQTGDFQEALANTSAAKGRFTPEDLYLRGSQLLAESYQHGVTSMRVFVEVDHIIGLKGLDVAVELKREFAHLIEVQICLFAQDPIFSTDYGKKNRKLLTKALDRHPDEIGALGTTPYVEQSQRTENKNIEWAVDTALERGLHLDFHLDYTLDETRPCSLLKVINQLYEYDWVGTAKPGKTIVIGHCTALTVQDETMKNLAEALARDPKLPIHFVGLPTSDLYMMGRPALTNTTTEDDGAQQQKYMPHARPRGTMQIPSMIKDFGLNGCLGVNNVGNAFTPYGDGDPLQLACWGTGLYHAGTVADAQLLYECVSERARRAIGMVGEDAEGVPLPGLLIDNVETVYLPGAGDGGGGKPLTVPARQRMGVKDVVWDPPSKSLRSIVG